ncbi:MAG: SGNH/GDSL hydrolase family protein [Candidatus Sumerlaeia bacterium]
MSQALIILICIFFAVITSIASAADYPALHDYKGDSSQWGKHIQRTMHLLETSTPEKPNKVRILFYGQSIMGGRWHKHVETWLREKYPYADLEIENRALGGFAAQYLVWPAEHDLYPFYPDLMIFHVYGDHMRYEEIIHNTRQRTTAEVMIMTDHWNRKAYVDGEYKISDWGRFYDEKVLPFVAKRYDCELVDVLHPWREYLEQNKLEPGDVLKDNVHLNDHGLWLMAELCIRQMVYRPELMTDTSKSLVKDYRIGGDVKLEDGRISLGFEGNRVDLISNSAGTAGFQVLLDGKAPSSYSDFYAFTRPTGVIPPDSWPSIYRVDSQALPLVEDWTAEILSIEEDHSKLTFKLTGTRTGEDGEGSSEEDFVSKSGRVAIESENWGVERSWKLKQVPAKAGMKIDWSCVPYFVDVYTPPTALGKESAVTLFQGGARRQATLELIARGDISEAVHTIRVYCPPVPAGEFKHMGLTPNMQGEPDFSEIIKPDLDK